MTVWLQVIGSDIRDDREWWDGGRSGDPAAVVFRLKVLQGNKHFSNGRYDDCL